MNAQTIGPEPFCIGDRIIGGESNTYFIADIAANHDGSIERALELIHMAAEAGADAAKFQHFTAPTIVSDFQFRRLPSVKSHQSNWKKTVFEVYQEASINLDWTAKLKQTCEDVGIEFMTSPYSFELVDFVDPFVKAFKIGSGDITWIDLITHIANKGKPVLIATGASSMEDVSRAVDAALSVNSAVCIMQCNTNYTGSIENFRHVNLRVLQQFAQTFPNCNLGFSDHTPGHAAVLGAVALGAKVVEKHFTDDNHRPGPDHSFSMNPRSWKEMVERTRELELALGTGTKIVEGNELETSIVQRRSLCVTRDLPAGSVLTRADMQSLRPCPVDSFAPYQINELIGKRLVEAVCSGQSITRKMIECLPTTHHPTR